jgi:hypothetical protein
MRFAPSASTRKTIADQKTHGSSIIARSTKMLWFIKQGRSSASNAWTTAHLVLQYILRRTIYLFRCSMQ